MSPVKTSAKKAVRKTAKSSRSNGKSSAVFSAEERAAMREAVRERKSGKTEGAEVVLAKIAQMKEPDRALGRRIHEIVMSNAPELTPRLWYGMPAYSKDGNVVCFFQDAAKFKARYATLGFSDKAHLDEGAMWPSSYALQELTPSDEARIAALVRKAVS